MATFELPELPVPRIGPHLLVGAASPLWAYFGAATAGGVAWWWMTRWTRPVNLEALLGRALPAAAAGLAAPLAETAEAVVAAVEAVAPDLPPEPIGGEAAPVSPLVEAVGAPEPPPADTMPEAEPGKARPRRPPAPNGSDAQA